MARERRGVALLAALVALALSAALATLTFSAAQAMRRAASTTRARVRVESGVGRAFGEVLAGWDAALDSLPVGRSVDIALGAEPPEAGAPLERHARVGRTSVGLYALTVELCAFTCARPLARRRARLWLERPAGPVPPSPGDSVPLAHPVPVTHWPVADLY